MMMIMGIFGCNCTMGHSRSRILIEASLCWSLSHTMKVKGRDMMMKMDGYLYVYLLSCDVAYASCV